jgi:endoglucanase
MRAAVVNCCVVAFLAGATSALGAVDPAAKIDTPVLKVEGNRLKTSQGTLVRLCGVNIASLEWTSKGEHVLTSLTVAITDWGSNIVRLPLSQDRWFGRVKEQNDGGAAYRRLVQELVQSAAARQCYVLLDLHWSDAGVWGRNIGQHWMPDDNSVDFWECVAPIYANHPAVLFDLYNEPHDVSWEVWRDGGAISEKSGKVSGEKLEYHTPGMQKLLDVCRSKGAKNVIVAGGLDWAYDLSGIAKGYALADPKGYGVVYATHIYPWKKNWDHNVAAMLDKYPVLVGEVGCQLGGKEEDPKTWAPKVLDYIEKHQLHWTAWDLHPAAGPCLIQDWKYTPTPYWGAPVKKALRDAAARRAGPPGDKR